MKKKSPGSVIRVLGMMTGTSCDGIDGSILEFFPDHSWQAKERISFSYPPALKRSILEVQQPDFKITLKNLLELHRDLGIWYAKTARQFRLGQLDLISNHGQTLAHYPDLKPRGVTLQLGDPHLLAHLTGVSVASFFRNGDLASGGQGAPLAPLFHQALAQKLLKKISGTSIHNLGGISNLSYFEGRNKIIAFDTGPANMWIDFAAQAASMGNLAYDKNGVMALLGRADHGKVAQLLKTIPFFKKTPPKSTGRDDFSKKLFNHFFKKTDVNTVATCTLLTAESIAQCYEKAILNFGHPLTKVLFCGGGAHNPTLLRWIESAIHRASPNTKFGIIGDAQFIEAQAFAFFGYQTLQGMGLGGEWTGGKKDSPPGALVPGRNWTSLLSKLKDHSKK